MVVPSNVRVVRSLKWGVAVTGLAWVLTAGAFPAASQATDYQGAADYWAGAQIKFSIDNGVLSGFTANNTGRVNCTTTTDTNPTPVATDINPLDVVAQTTPVALADGSFSVQTTGEDDYGHVLTVVASGTASGDVQRADGTLTIDGTFDAFSKHYDCHDVQPFQALVVPLVLNPETNPDYSGSPVSFDLKGGRITKLRAIPSVECASGAVISSDFSSNEYRYDPIHTDKKGKFSLTASALTSYDTVMEFSIDGRVSGDKARGRISATYVREINGEIEECHGSKPWTATASTPTSTDEPGAYYAITAYRFGSGGDYDYWFRVVLGGCANANRVSVQVLGQGKPETVSCSGHISTEPLTPQRTYKIRITAMKTEVVHGHRKVIDKSSVVESVYLPGPDGNWQQILKEE